MDGLSTTAFFAGSFNPFTTGHADIVERALHIFGRVIIAIGINVRKADDDADRRAESIRRLYAAEPRVDVITYSGLTAAVAAEHNATVLLRGVRTASDYEYELQMADINRSINGIETVLLTARPELASVSSSMVRELRSFGFDTSRFTPSDF